MTDGGENDKSSGLNWAQIELEYRLGKFSLREIAKHHGTSPQAILRRAKAHGWSRVKLKRLRRRPMTDRVFVLFDDGSRDMAAAEAALRAGAGIVDSDTLVTVRRFRPFTPDDPAPADFQYPEIL
jgi:hypothetical protein